MQTPPYNLILSYPFESKLMDLLIDSIREARITIPGVIGPKEVVTEFSEKWCSTTKEFSNVVVFERIYRLDKVDQNLVSLKEGEELALAEVSDLKLILNWMYDFDREACPESEVLSREDFVKKQHENILDAINDKQFYLLKKDNDVVCMARTPGQTVHGRLVNYVYTPVELRKNGYASTCVANLSQSILDQGHRHCMLFTDLSNSTSNSIYQKIGYRPVIDVNLIRFST